MRSTRKDIVLHSERLTGGTTRSEQAESIDFFARLAEDDKLPKRIDDQLIDIFISTAKDKRRVLAVRANALNVLMKLLERRSTSLTHDLVDKGIIRVLADIIVGRSLELRAAGGWAARSIADCCDDCRADLSVAGVVTGIMKQLRDGGFDASVEAARGAVGLIAAFVLKLRADEWVEQTVAREFMIPALARTLHRLGADDDDIGKMSLAVLLKINYYDGWTLRHRKLLKNYLVAVIASNKRLLARQALLLMHRLTQLASTAQMRPLIARPDFMLHLAQWVGWPDDVANPAENVLRCISWESTDDLGAVVLTNPALITALAGTIRPVEGWRGGGAVAILMKILEGLTAGGPTTQSQYLLGFGFLPRVVAYVADLDPDDNIVEITRTALYAVLNAHPEWSRQLHEAGASLSPLELAIRLRAEKEPQQYIVMDEDCDAI